jgi:pyridoxamine 5'-phosphate oxidase
MNDIEIKQAQIKLMAEAENCYLTTINSDGYPYTRSMFNLRNREQYPAQAKYIDGHDDEFVVFFGTNTSAVKTSQIKANPAVSVYYCKPKEINGLMLSGDIEIVTDPAIGKKIWQEGWERYYPTGPTDPDYTVLRLKPRLARGWYKGASFEFGLS